MASIEQRTVGRSREEWRTIPGYAERYEVSSEGRVRSYATTGGIGGDGPVPRVMSLPIGGPGYRMVRLRAFGLSKTWSVHRLVAAAFHGDPNPGQVVRHLDGSRTNNRADNLAWGTHVENARDAVAHGTALLGERNPSSRLTRLSVAGIRAVACSRLGFRSRPYNREIGEVFGVTESAVRDIINGRTWSHAVD